MTAKRIARNDILSLRTLMTGAQDQSSVRLNANEAPDSHRFPDDNLGLNRYPEIRPSGLCRKLADLYGVPTGHLLVTRGSSEGIDILIRTFCRAGQDSILTLPPTFELYRYFAQIQSIETISMPLSVADNFAFDADAVLEACTSNTRLIFICSPNNPTGNIVPFDDIARIAAAREGKSMVVVDEAYIEFSKEHSLAAKIGAHENLVVLRTLSKAYALAGARCGAVIANKATIDILTKVLPPFSFSTPAVDNVLQALQDDSLAAAKNCIAKIVSERKRLFDELTRIQCVLNIWPSHGNFLLFKLADQPAVLNHLKSSKILILGFGDQAGLKDCARITIGSESENDAFLAALHDYGSKP
ncbi:MAG: histidinol-phosphate transaminase [Woeseiaceae bacterium]